MAFLCGTALLFCLSWRNQLVSTKLPKDKAISQSIDSWAWRGDIGWLQYYGLIVYSRPKCTHLSKQNQLHLIEHLLLYSWLISHFVRIAGKFEASAVIIDCHIVALWHIGIDAPLALAEYFDYLMSLVLSCCMMAGCTAHAQIEDLLYT